MNNFKSSVPCICTGNGRKAVCERHDNNEDIPLFIRKIFFLLFAYFAKLPNFPA